MKYTNIIIIMIISLSFLYGCSDLTSNGKLWIFPSNSEKEALDESDIINIDLSLSADTKKQFEIGIFNDGDATVNGVKLKFTSCTDEQNVSQEKLPQIQAPGINIHDNEFLNTNFILSLTEANYTSGIYNCEITPYVEELNSNDTFYPRKVVLEVQ